MAARRVQLRHERDVDTGVERLDRGPHPGAAGADHEYVVRGVHGSRRYRKRLRSASGAARGHRCRRRRSYDRERRRGVDPALPSLGSTARRDTWWVAPVADRRRARRSSASTRSSSRSRASNYRYEEGGASYLSPFFSPDVESALRHRPAVLAGAPRALGAARPSGHLLLLPQGVLPLVLPLAARLRGRRPEGLQRREPAPADPPERPPLLPLLRDRRARLPLVRRRPRVLLRADDGSLEFGIGLGSLVLLAERRRACGVHVRLQLAAPPRRRASSTASRCSRARARAAQGVARRRPAQRPAHASGPGSASSTSRSPTSTSASPRPASSTTRGSSERRGDSRRTTTTSW